METVKQYVRLARKTVNFPNKFKIYPGSIYGRQDNIFWVCDCFKTINGKLPVHIYEAEWRIMFVDRTCPIYKWVQSAIFQLGYKPEIVTEKINYVELMKHDRRHKKGSGSRIYTNQINGPLKWNEVTEAAHWFGHGNASVVASNI